MDRGSGVRNNTKERNKRIREMNELKYVSRIDDGCQKTWFVRVHCLYLPGKSFCDSKFGGCKKALSAAIAWRDQQLDSNKDKVLLSRFRFHKKAFKNNLSTGILGIRVESKESNNNITYSYVAYSGAYPKVRRRNFAWIKYGKREALAKAIAYRKKMEQERRWIIKPESCGQV